MTTSSNNTPPAGFRLGLYRVLGIADPSAATPESLRAAYRRLALEHHPDKQQVGGEGGGDAGAFAAIADAYRILGDPKARAAYDQWAKTERATSEPHFDVDLDDMTPHYDPSDSADEDPCPVRWTYPCRCGGEIVVDVADLEAQLAVFPCSGCTMRCRVVYYALDE
ncbi:hypothetical protein H9P43_009637 [Blastocladiella emersonii ATCC 22665]|nr:hypothetical protein H9P43_009637 [Blastocladiella emersonii ATCC 22665]